MAKKEKPIPIPARTIEGRENQIIKLAVDEAERRLRDGTASSQIITTLLNLGTTKAKLELEKLKADLALSEAKVKEIELRKTEQEKYDQAIAAMKLYSGYNDDEEGDYYDDSYDS